MAPDVLARLFQQRSQNRLIRFDEQILMNASIADLDEKLWQKFKTPLTPKDDTEFLLKIIIEDEDGKIHPTIAGMLMASDSPNE